MNENENGELLMAGVLRVTVDDEGNIQTDGRGNNNSTSNNPSPYNYEAVSVADMDDEQQERFWNIQRSLPTAYNYMFNFENLNIDNQTFFWDKMLHHTYPDQTSPYTTTNTDGSKYLTLFKPLYTRTLNLDTLSKQQFSICRQVHYLGDIKYNEVEFTELENKALTIYLPSMRKSGQEPTYDLQTQGDLEFVKTVLSKEEAEGLQSKFGGLTGSMTDHIEERFQELTTEVSETIISRENVPNIIQNNAVFDGINDLSDEGTSNVTISTTSTSVTTY